MPITILKPISAALTTTCMHSMPGMIDNNRFCRQVVSQVQPSPERQNYFRGELLVYQMPQNVQAENTPSQTTVNLLLQLKAYLSDENGMVQNRISLTQHLTEQLEHQVLVLGNQTLRHQVRDIQRQISSNQLNRAQIQESVEQVLHQLKKKR